jgi:hypothetical protein
MIMDEVQESETCNTPSSETFRNDFCKIDSTVEVPLILPRHLSLMNIAKT